MTISREPIWTPTCERRAGATITEFEDWLAREAGLRFADYEALWRWSTDEPDAFWGLVWRYFDVPARKPYERVLADARMPGAKWFTGAELNFVDGVLRHAGLATPAIVFESEAAGSGEIGWTQLRREVAAFAATLRALGVVPGDRVAGYLPNVPQAIVAFLGAASVGAIWSVCAPDMGPVSVGDRFAQIAPKVLVACDGYRFAGKAFDRRAVLAEVLGRLPSVETIVWLAHLDAAAPAPPEARVRRVLAWADAVGREHGQAPEGDAFEPVALPFDHPLWILYSSGTTGLPKAIVHGHGGVLVNGYVNIVLHGDVRPGRRVFWSSSTSWVVWNVHLLNLLAGATLVLYDGAVTGAGAAPDWGFLWQLAGRHRVTSFGAGAAFHHGCLKAGVVPREIADLDALACVSSTGSPLSPEGYRWLYDAVKADLWVNSVSGGTDLVGGFLVGLPTLPVRSGEMQCRTLGAAVHSFDESGRPVIDQVGELVCTKPLPSMPLFFWNDPDGSRYLESYFDMFTTADGGKVWRHGDWLRLVPHAEAVGGIIYGRSDATINRQGIRMGTAELYRAVETFDEVLDSMVVDLEYLGRESYMALFVQLRAGATLDAVLEARLRDAIRTQLSARHVPNEIVAVAAIPKTLTGKKLELPVKKLMLGQPVEKVVKRDALADPAAIDWYVAFARRHLTRG